MTRLLLLAAAALLPTGIAAAETVHDTHTASGALAGRSPHKMLHPVAATTPSCDRPAMHSVPSGKGHVFGRHALPSEQCAAASAVIASPETARGE